MTKFDNKDLQRHNSMLFPLRWYETLSKLPDREFRLMFEAIGDYSQNRTEPTFDNGIIAALWLEIKQRMDFDRAKYDAICQRNQRNGLNGGRPAKPKNPNGFSRNPTKPKKPDADADAEADAEADVKESTLSCTKETAEPFSLNDTEHVSFKQWTLKDFQDDVSQHKEFSNIAEAFISYWSEPTASGKMRFQLEKTWETGRRLKRWADNQKTLQNHTTLENSTQNIQEKF